jgi:hypothetical protein
VLRFKRVPTLRAHFQNPDGNKAAIIEPRKERPVSVGQQSNLRDDSQLLRNDHSITDELCFRRRILRKLRDDFHDS